MDTNSTVNPGILKYITWAGSVRRAAALLGMSRGHLQLVRDGKQRCTPERALEIERVTGRKVKRTELRPDVWER